MSIHYSKGVTNGSLLIPRSWSSQRARIECSTSVCIQAVMKPQQYQQMSGFASRLDMGSVFRPVSIQLEQIDQLSALTLPTCCVQVKPEQHVISLDSGWLQKDLDFSLPPRSRTHLLHSSNLSFFSCFHISKVLIARVTKNKNLYSKINQAQICINGLFLKC